MVLVLTFGGEMLHALKSRRKRRIGAVVATSLSLLLLGITVAPAADAHGRWSDRHRTNSYYPGTPLGPMGSAAEDARCDVDDRCTGRDRDGDGRYDYVRPKNEGLATTTKPSTTSKPPTTKQPTPTSTPNAGSQGVKETAYITGYSWEDNTPRGSRAISNPVIHNEAGGKGTFNDPITVAVGHSINPTKMRFPEGTKFYVPILRAYFIVEDTCGDGNTPQNSGCWTGYPSGAAYWIDVYLGSDPDDSCMDSFTGVHTVIRNPDAGWVAVERPGDVGSTYKGIGSGCKLYGDMAVRAL